MKAAIVTIGNSQGVRIPKILLDQSGLSGDVELELCDAGIIIRKARKTRENWAESFRQMADNNDDELVTDPTPSNYAREKWRW
ncbi:MAG: AbrB/MazE/SpoVT family DNA-binding domain-containing protein [Acidobacteria bacterium]|nr:AbrB/MazE/SpoVT family DNA-binding domain-containing protein [Acidobacteriota bacterium]